MSLPVSNQLRICSSCDGAIDPGCKYGLDPNGDVVCEDCIPSESLEQYDDWAASDDRGPDPFDDWEGWSDYSDLAYEDTW